MLGVHGADFLCAIHKAENPVIVYQALQDLPSDPATREGIVEILPGESRHAGALRAREATPQPE